MATFLLVCVLLFNFASAQECTLNNEVGPQLITDAVLETQIPGAIFWTGTAEVTLERATLGNGTNYIAILTAPTNVHLSVSTTFKNYIDFVRKDTLAVTLTIFCTDGSSKEYTIEIPVVDVNTKPPVISPKNINAILRSNWNSNVPINLYNSVTVTDQDFNVENANVVCESNDYMDVNLVEVHGDGSEPYKWDILLYVKKVACQTNWISFNTYVFCSDGLHTANLSVNAQFDIYKPEFPLTYYTSNVEGGEVSIGDELVTNFEVKAVDRDDPNIPLNYTINSDLYMHSHGAIRFAKDFTWQAPLTSVIEITAVDAMKSNATVPIVIVFA